MSSASIFLLGASTFALKTPDDLTVAEAIGVKLSSSFEFYSRNALRLSEVPQEIILKMKRAEFLVLHLGVMEFLPSLKKRLYPCLNVQKRNGFLYDIKYEPFPALAYFVNIYNRICFNLQLKLELCLMQEKPITLTDFLGKLILDPDSQIRQVFLLSPPPIKHPGSLEAIVNTLSEIDNVKAIFDCVSIIDYMECSSQLNHDSTGHLKRIHRGTFSINVAVSIMRRIQ